MHTRVSGVSDQGGGSSERVGDRLYVFFPSTLHSEQLKLKLSVSPPGESYAPTTGAQRLCQEFSSQDRESLSHSRQKPLFRMHIHALIQHRVSVLQTVSSSTHTLMLFLLATGNSLL